MKSKISTLIIEDYKTEFYSIMFLNNNADLELYYM